MGRSCTGSSPGHRRTPPAWPRTRCRGAHAPTGTASVSRVGAVRGRRSGTSRTAISSGSTRWTARSTCLAKPPRPACTPCSASMRGPPRRWSAGSGADHDRERIMRYGDDIVALTRPVDAAGDLDPLVDRVDDARVVMLGEASHGTHEFYRWRALLTQRLISECGFSFVAVEGDWPDCDRVDRSVRGEPGAPA